MKLFNALLIFLCIGFLSCGDEDGATVEQIALITPKSGLDDITFSSTGQEVIDKFGAYEYLTVIRSLTDAAFVMWYENGLAFQLNHIDTEGFTLQETLDMADELIDLDQKIIQIIIQKPFNAVTTEDIAIGSSKPDVLAKYGEPSSVLSSVEIYEDFGLGFWYNSNDLVDRIDVKP